ncbi:MAG: hypothetical protein U0744_08340 [Gemmataceae bacterium]
MTRSTKAIATFGCLASMLALLGCPESGPQKAPVKGTVTLDGTKLESGSMQFMSAENKVPSSAFTIKDGEFMGEAYVGPMKVLVSAQKVVGKKKVYDTPDSPVKDITKELIPDRYNTKTELTAEVKPGPNAFEFALKSTK